MFLLILESLGSTELFFILIMALVFFGPRKLPQLSRTIGKNLAEFRRASEDFKRTWEREVALEDLQSEPIRVHSSPAQENSILNPLVVEPPADQIVAREAGVSNTSLPSETTTGETVTTNETITPEAPRKQDWL
ncbi:MAG TPA: twin-arginine translocase TatA/TatE family subunit [Pyrinomonadaceae bacterium]|nr:twin-arginine translocase TatA/TatE family subunit [Pyrinomonadaceae bacterium]